MKSEKRMLSAIFALNLGWKNQVYLDVTGRNDWSSALVYANGTGNHSYFTLQFQVLGLLVKHSVSNCPNGSLSLRFVARGHK